MKLFPDRTVRLTAVIVLYHMLPEQSQSFLSLRQSASAVVDIDLDLHILLYDNTPNAQSPEILPVGVEYFAPLRNKGLAEAYRMAIGQSIKNGSQWLLTLDQDTSLPEEFLHRMAIHAAQLSETTIAAIVPQIIDSDRILSPLSFCSRSHSFVVPVRISGGTFRRRFCIQFSGHVARLRSASGRRLHSLVLARLQRCSSFQATSALWQAGFYSGRHPSQTQFFHDGPGQPCLPSALLEYRACRVGHVGSQHELHRRPGAHRQADVPPAKALQRPT